VVSLFVIPVLDMTRLIFLRLARGQSPMSADHDHLHHRIERFVPWRYGLAIYLAMVALPIVIAFSGPGMGFVGILAAFALYGVVWRMTLAHAQSPIGGKLNRVAGS
jgi:UDP-N-acetylmuramyl pentapeptide phosphotransferase/UDP-N-acetylglucosamine-1-phosphate transferase